LTLNEKTIIPKTGRIGRLAKIIENDTNRGVLFKVMHDVERYTSTSNYKQKAAWVRGAIERLEQEVGVEKSRTILEQCGRKCCGVTSRKRAKESMNESSTLKEFIEKLNDKGIGGSRLKLEDENKITGGYNVCYCGQVKHTQEPFLSDTYCHCSVGWYKQLFESSLNKSVNVKLVQSIICGSETCEFIIHL